MQVKKNLAAILRALFGTRRPVQTEPDVLEHVLKRLKSPVIRASDIDRVGESCANIEAIAKSVMDAAETTVSDLQHELSKAHRRVDFISSTITDGVITLDHKGSILSLNSAALAMFCMPSDRDIIGQRATTFISESKDSNLVERESVRLNAYMTEHVRSLPESKRSPDVYRNLYKAFVSGKKCRFAGHAHEVTFQHNELALLLELTAHLINPEEPFKQWTYIVIVRDVGRRKAEIRELRNSDLFQKALLQSIPLPMFYTDSNYVIKWSNSQFIELFGKSLMGRSCLDCFDGRVVKFLSEDVPATLALATMAKGQPRDMIFNRSVIRDSDNFKAGVVCTILDTTDLNDVQLVHESLVRDFTKLAEVLPDAITIGRQSDIDMCNPAARTLLTASEYEKHHSALDTDVTEDSPMVRANIAFIVDGVVRTYDVIKVLLDNARILTVGRDITEIVSVRTAYQSLCTAFDALDCPVFLADAEFRIVYFNRKFADLFSPATGMHVHELLGCDSSCVTRWNEHVAGEVVAGTITIRGRDCSLRVVRSPSTNCYAGFIDDHSDEQATLF